MYQIDNSSAATTQPASTPPGTPGFFTDGSVTGGIPATIVPAEWFNAVQQELINVLVAAGITPVKSTFTQLASAIKAIASASGFVPYSSAFGAYPVGALLQRSDGTGGWINAVASNTSDPDTGGAGWLPVLGSTTPLSLALTTGTVTPTALQAASPLITLTGTLTGNCTVVLPAWVGVEWTIVDATTRGAFTITFKTASGSSAVIPTGITNIYCNASGMQSQMPSGLLLGVPITFTSSGTWTPNPLAKKWRIRGTGGGAGGAASTATGASACSGTAFGQSAAAGEFWFTGLSGAQTITIGAGGAGGATSGASGTTGGNTTLGSVLTLPGGRAWSSTSPGAAPYNATNGGALAPPTVGSGGTTVWSIATNGGGGSMSVISTSFAISGISNSSFGGSAQGYGAGGAGAFSGASSIFLAGTAGNAGFLTIEEFS
jgi:hypothetical protein